MIVAFEICSLDFLASMLIWNVLWKYSKKLWKDSLNKAENIFLDLSLKSKEKKKRAVLILIER